MPEYLAPGVYVEEIERGARPIEGVPTSSAAFLGEAGRGPLRPRLVTGFADYERRYGRSGPYLPYAVRGFFENGGRSAFICRLTRTGAAPTRDDLARGLSRLEAEELRDVTLVAAPGLVSAEMTGAVIAHCEKHRRFAVLDCPRDDPGTLDPRDGPRSADAACYAPWLEVEGPRTAARTTVPPSGHVLGVYARTGVERGVWKAPANEVVKGALGLEHEIGETAQDLLNPRGVNAIRRFPGRGIRVWGARTLSADPEWKYVNIRRLFIYLERSIDKGTQWVVFEPNDERTWAAVRVTVEDFLHRQWRAGALLGSRPRDAYFVRCDRTTMTQADIDSGRLIVEIGFAPLRPAEFVIFRIGQWTAEARH